MPDDFKLEGDNLEPEASLDDFFQPSTEPAKPGKPEPKKGAKPDARLPVDKSKPLVMDDEPAPPPALEVTDAETEPAVPEKSGGGLLSNKLLLIGIAVLAVLVVGVGVYYGYTKFFSKEEEAVAPAPQSKAPAKAPAPAPEKIAQAAPAAETKQPPAAPAKPETPAVPAAKATPKPEAKAVPPEKKPAPPAKAPEKIAPPPPAKPAPEAKAKPATPPLAPGKEAAAKQPEIKKAPSVPLPTKTAPAPAAKTAPAPIAKTAPAPTAKIAPAPPAATAKTTPAKPPVGARVTPPAQSSAQSKPAPAAKAAPTPAPKAAMVSSGPYTLQVGSYAFEESKTAPEAKLKELGLTDYHYVDQAQRVHLYDVVAGKGLDKSRADALLNSLAGLKFVPRLEPKGDRYQVIAYSYGNRADAERAQAKIEKAGLGKVSISSYSKTMTMHQLRVGGFPSAAATRATLAALRKAGFHPVIVRER